MDNNLSRLQRSLIIGSASFIVLILVISFWFVISFIIEENDTEFNSNESGGENFSFTLNSLEVGEHSFIFVVENKGDIPIDQFMITLFSEDWDYSEIFFAGANNFILPNETKNLNIYLSDKIQNNSFLNRSLFIKITPGKSRGASIDYIKSEELVFQLKEGAVIREPANVPGVKDIQRPSGSSGGSSSGSSGSSGSSSSSGSTPSPQTEVPSNTPTINICADTLDSDGDFLPDSWEKNFSLNSNIIDSNGDSFPDSEEDLDEDGFVNLLEFRSCTNPLNPNSKPSSTSSPQILSFYGSYIDGVTLKDQQAWINYKLMAKKLSDRGFTHTGIRVWDDNSAILGSRLSELRSLNLKFALLHDPGQKFLLNSERLDSQVHSSNNQNLKFFGAYNFNPNSCSSSCSCSSRPHRTALDPGYSGTIWQNELTLLKNILSHTILNQNDFILLETEIWGPSVSDTLSCYPESLNDGGRYSGETSNRKAQFYLNWRKRGEELKAEVEKVYPNIPLVFYNDQEPKLLKSEGTSMPQGIGDIHNSPFYHLPLLSTLANELNEADYSNSYAWISITQIKREGKYLREPLDPKVVQKAGKMLKDEGLKGVILWPGPETLKINNQFFEDSQYISLSEHFANGYIKGIDPGSLAEICGDDIDNDGDFICDENCGLASDCDGLNETKEISLGLNPNSRDSNNNGISDGFEDSNSNNLLDLFE